MCTSGSVVGRDLPALQLGHFLRERGFLDAPGYPKLLLDQLALVYLLHEILPYLEVLHIYYIAGETLGHLLAYRARHLLASLHGFLTLPQSNGDGLAALAIYKEIGALIAVHLAQHLRDSNHEAVEQLWLPVGIGVGCAGSRYAGEHDPPTSFLLSRERRLRGLTSCRCGGQLTNSPLSTLLCSRHVLGIRHTHSATALGRAHLKVYSPECVEMEFCELRHHGVLGSSRPRNIHLAYKDWPCGRCALARSASILRVL